MNDMVIQNKLAALNAIKSKFTSTINKIYINSLGREVNFREITVAEQKKLARIMIDNENRKDIVYDAQCAILKTICLEDNFDVYQLTEFDKIKLLLMLYQRNMIKHDIMFTCPECHTENKYKLDFQHVIDKLDKFDIEPEGTALRRDIHTAVCRTIQRPLQRRRTVHRTRRRPRTSAQRHKLQPEGCHTPWRHCRRTASHTGRERNA